MFYVYILQSKKDDNLYVGYTNDFKKRFIKHNSGKVYSTKLRRPFTWIYLEICHNKEDATQREKYLKSGRGKRFIKQRLSNYFQGHIN